MSETLKHSKIIRDSNLSEMQNTGLLIGLILSEQHHFAKDSLKTGWPAKEAVAFLEEMYFSKKNSSAYGILNFIRDEGERTVYNIILPHFLATNKKEKRKELLEKNYMAIDLFVEYCHNLSDCEPLLMDKNTLAIDENDLKKGILAWDMAKLVSIARLSFDSGLISEEDARTYIETACSQCREAFDCWHEIAKSYVIGAAVEIGLNENFAIILNYTMKALKDEDSLWKQTSLK